MATELGEYIVGAYLEEIRNCDVVYYNPSFVCPPEITGRKSSVKCEIDVVGLSVRGGFEKIYICEVTTHLKGINVRQKAKAKPMEVIKNKLIAGLWYASSFFPWIEHVEFEVWCNYVPKGNKMNYLKSIQNDFLTYLSKYNKKKGDKCLTYKCGLVINEQYADCLMKLFDKAKKDTSHSDNSFYRGLQVLQQTLKRNKYINYFKKEDTI